MKVPQTRIWIDARGEKPDPAQHAEITYQVENLEKTETKTRLMEAVYPLVKEIRLLENGDNLVQIVYNPTLISAGFIDYLLQKKGLVYQKKDK